MHRLGKGYLLKEIDVRGVVQAIFEVAPGKSILDPAKSGGNQPKHLNVLSPQERRVLALTAEGATHQEVGQDMNLSETTIKNHLARYTSRTSSTN